MTQTQTKNLSPNPQFVKAVQEAHEHTALVKGKVLIKHMKVAGKSDARDLIFSFVDSKASEGKERQVYRSVTCTLWGSEAKDKGDYLIQFAKYDEKKEGWELECLVGLNTGELTRRTYTGQDGSEKEVHQVRWMVIFLDLTNTIIVGEKKPDEAPAEPADLD